MSSATCQPFHLCPKVLRQPLMASSSTHHPIYQTAIIEPLLHLIWKCQPWPDHTPGSHSATDIQFAILLLATMGLYSLQCGVCTPHNDDEQGFDNPI